MNNLFVEKRIVKKTSHEDLGQENHEEQLKPNPKTRSTIHDTASNSTCSFKTTRLTFYITICCYNIAVKIKLFNDIAAGLEVSEAG